MKKLLCFCFCVFAALSCGKKETAAPPAAAPKYDVMLISIDTLRSDYLKLYDPRGVDVPHMEELARDAVVFRRAISQVPYTLPSHCTMLSGFYPVGHGVKDNVHDLLPESIPTLAELFKKQNYHTAGFVGSMVLARRTGLGRGFDYYDDFFSRADVRASDLGNVERRARDVLRSFEHWYDHRPPAGNAFMFLHFYDPHSPYDPPPGYAASGSQQDLYRGEIRYVDDVLGDLFSYLKQKSAWGQTIILLTSDHGEMLQEHEEIGHGFFLYQAALSVPLILRLPGQSGRHWVDDPVQLVDIAPTLMEAVSASTGGMQGESLLPLARNGARKKNRLAFSESYFAALQMGVSPIFSIQDGAFKYVDSPKPELYNLSSDPGETRNLADAQKSEARQFQTRLQQYRKTYFKPGLEAEKHKVSSEEAEQFAALGYLGGQISESSWDRKKDPKDYIGEWNKSLEASYLVEHGEYARAIPLIQDIRRSGSLPAESVTMLEARCYQGLGDIAKAESILTAAGGTPGALNALAELYAQTGRPDKANAAYTRVLKEDFSYFALYDYVLFLKRAGKIQDALVITRQAQSTRNDADIGRPFFAEMYIALGDLPSAEKILASLLEERPWESKWTIELSAVYQAQGRAQQALMLLETQYAQFSDDAEYLLRLGILYNALGEKKKEMETFQQLIRSYPGDPRGYFYLAKAMLDTRQDPRAVIDLASRGLSLNPRPEMQVFGHYLLGNAYQATGRPAESRKEFDIAQKMEKQLAGQ